MASTDNNETIRQVNVQQFLGLAGMADTTGAAAAVPEAAGVFKLAVLDKDALESSPIDPSWIIEGSPEAKSASLVRLGHHWTCVDHWSCTAGKFRWHYAFDETILILEGEALIEDDRGHSYRAVPGTTLFFPDGSAANWHVPDYVRKIAFNQKHVPTIFHKALRAANKMRRMFAA